jgi:YVTN family beta-propeller protein
MRFARRDRGDPRRLLGRQLARRWWFRVPAGVAVGSVVSLGLPATSAWAATYIVAKTIPVGSEPRAVAVDPTTGNVYVANSNTDTVSVIDEATSIVTNTITVGNGPLGVAVDPTRGEVYVTNDGAASVSVIDESTGTVTNTIAVGAQPYGVAVDPTTGNVYVANLASGTVSVISESTDTVTDTITVGLQPIAIAVDPTTGNVYVATHYNTVWVIDASTDTITNTITVGNASPQYPNGIGVDPTTGLIYVSYVTDTTNIVAVIDESTGTVTNSITVGAQPYGVGVDPTTATVFVANEGGTISVIDESTGTVTNTITVGSGPQGIAVDPTTGLVYVTNQYVANESYGSVSVITSATAPGVPSDVTATAGDTQAAVSFSPPSSNGGLPVTSYTVTATDNTNSSNGGQTTTGAASPITVNGLTNGDSYTFTVTATNLVGPGPAPAPSNAVTPTNVPESTTTTLTASTRAPVTGQPIAYTATVTLTPPFSGSPSGQVTVTDSFGQTCQASLNASTPDQATCDLPAPAPSSDQVTATYAGATIYADSTSNTVTESVTDAATTTTVTANPEPSVTGQATNFNATVVADAPSVGQPTGEVTFVIDNASGKQLTCLAGDTPTLSAGAAMCQIPATDNVKAGAGPLYVLVGYRGAAGYQTSGTSSYHQINPDNTTVQLTSSANPSIPGHAVTFTALVSADSPGSGTPAGKVVFSFNPPGAITCQGGNTVKLTNAGFAVCKVPAGQITSAVTVTANYKGGKNYLPSGNTLSQNVS